MLAQFPRSSLGKESACNAGDLGSIPVLGRSPGEGNGYPLQYYGMENSIERKVWEATVHGVTESDNSPTFTSHNHFTSGLKVACI